MLTLEECVWPKMKTDWAESHLSCKSALARFLAHPSPIKPCKARSFADGVTSAFTSTGPLCSRRGQDSIFFLSATELYQGDLFFKMLAGSVIERFHCSIVQQSRLDQGDNTQLSGKSVVGLLWVEAHWILRYTKGSGLRWHCCIVGGTKWGLWARSQANSFHRQNSTMESRENPPVLVWWLILTSNYNPLPFWGILMRRCCKYRGKIWISMLVFFSA